MSAWCALVFLIVPFALTAQLPSYLPTNGLVAWYPFNGNANDESGNGTNGIVNGATLAPNRFGQSNSAYSFDGINDFIQYPQGSNTPINIVGDISFGYWIKTTAAEGIITSFGDQLAGQGGYLSGLRDGPAEPSPGQLGYWVGGTWITSSALINDDNWTFIMVTYTGGQLKLYVNGNLDSQHSGMPAASWNGNRTLGKPNYVDARFFSGLLDDFVIYSRALSATEINSLYTANSANNTSNTVNPAPPGIPYQAEVRNENGEVLANTNVNIRFTLHEQAANGTVSYQETHALTTNELGLFAATIGAGTATQGTFAGINWAQTTKFLQVEVDAGNGYITMGNQQLMSVPYALYAANSQPGPQGPAGPQGSVGPQGPAGQYIAGSGIVINNDTISLQNSSSLDPTANRVRIGFATSTTWTCPVGVNQITIELWGAGGTSGSGSTLCDPYLGWTCYGASGGKGGYNKQLVDVIPGNTYTITVGQVNGGIQEVPCRMNNGGNSSFNNQYTALGGQGGRRGQGCCSCGSYGQGADGTVTNFSHPTTQLVVPTTYIPQSYVTNIYPSCCAPADTKGFVVISY